MTIETERDVQRRVVKHFRAFGWSVYPTNQRRSSRIALGLPDFWAMKPGRGGLWFEVKVPGGKQRPAQQSFQSVCQVAGVRYVCGGLVEAVQAIGGTIEP